MPEGMSFAFKEYVQYAGDDVTRWSRAVGGILVHRTLGEGVIEDVVLFQGQRRVVAVFDSDNGQRRKTLSVKALLDLHRVTEIRLVGDSVELAELKRRFEQRAQRIARLEELAVKFKLPSRSASRSLKLLETLELMDAGTPLPGEYEDWLQNNQDKALVKLLADYRYREFLVSRDPWTLARASALYRDAGLAEHAVKVTGEFSPDGARAPASAAVLTSRAAALADLDRLDESDQCAQRALALQPERAHAYNLLGRLEYMRGRAEAGEAYFAKAETVGNDPAHADTHRRKAVESAKGEVKRGLARFLLDKDPHRYAWAKKYL